MLKNSLTKTKDDANKHRSGNDKHVIGRKTSKLFSHWPHTLWLTKEMPLWVLPSLFVLKLESIQASSRVSVLRKHSIHQSYSHARATRPINVACLQYHGLEYFELQ